MYNHLQTGTYAIDTDNIFPSYNDKQVAKNGYPQVIIFEPEISKTILTTGTTANAVKQADVMYHIQAWHNSAAGIKTLVDEIDNNISTGQSVFRLAGLRQMRGDFITESYGQTYKRPNQTIHYCDISVNFRYRGST